MILKIKRKNPDYAFQKLTDEEIAFKKSSNKRILTAILCALVILAIIATVVIYNKTHDSYTTQAPEGVLVVNLPANKSEYEIYPTQEFTFDIAVHYEVGSSPAHYGITDHDRGQIGMFFSDNLLCERIAYDTIRLNENVKPGTEFSVTLKFNSQLSTIKFTVVEKPVQTEQ